MERKNTNLVFFSGIFLLFALLLIGKVYKKESDATFLDDYRYKEKRNRTQEIPRQSDFFRNVSLQETHLPEEK